MGLTGVSRKAMDFGVVVGHVQCTDILIFYILYACVYLVLLFVTCAFDSEAIPSRA